ncbi:MAG: hypothetical protein ACPHW5_09360, partial [Candidatus Puniceispirillales bacterium]
MVSAIMGWLIRWKHKFHWFVCFIPLNTDDDATRLEAAAQIKRDTKDIASCNDLEKLHVAYGSDLVFHLGILPLYSLAPDLRDMIAPLDKGIISDVVAYKEGIAAFMVCDKKAPQLELP